MKGSVERGAWSVERLVTLALALAGVLLLAAPCAAQPRAARAIARGQVLAADDIVYATADTGARSTLHAVRSTLVGWVARRMIAPGEPLRAPAVTPPDAVQAGDAVQLVWRDAGIELRLRGTAAAAAPVGGRTVVRVDARRRLEGIVLAPGLVQVGTTR